MSVMSMMAVMPLVCPVNRPYPTRCTSMISISMSMSMTITSMTMSVMNWMICMANSFNDSFESSMGAGFVFYNTGGTISFFKAILTSDMISISMFVLRLDIVRMRIMDTILKFVVSVALEKND